MLWERLQTRFVPLSTPVINHTRKNIIIWAGERLLIDLPLLFQVFILLRNGAFLLNFFLFSNSTNADSISYFWICKYATLLVFVYAEFTKKNGTDKFFTDWTICWCWWWWWYDDTMIFGAGSICYCRNIKNFTILPDCYVRISILSICNEWITMSTLFI